MAAAVAAAAAPVAAVAALAAVLVVVVVLAMPVVAVAVPAAVLVVVAAAMPVVAVAAPAAVLVVRPQSEITISVSHHCPECAHGHSHCFHPLGLDSKDAEAPRSHHGGDMMPVSAVVSPREPPQVRLNATGFDVRRRAHLRPRSHVHRAARGRCPPLRWAPLPRHILPIIATPPLALFLLRQVAARTAGSS